VPPPVQLLEEPLDPIGVRHPDQPPPPSRISSYPDRFRANVGSAGRRRPFGWRAEG
jgi:hypothetical protein